MDTIRSTRDTTTLTIPVALNLLAEHMLEHRLNPKRVDTDGGLRVGIMNADYDKWLASGFTATSCVTKPTEVGNEFWETVRITGRIPTRTGFVLTVTLGFSRPLGARHLNAVGIG